MPNLPNRSAACRVRPAKGCVLRPHCPLFVSILGRLGPPDVAFWEISTDYSP
jgi:hypothetical protein